MFYVSYFLYYSYLRGGVISLKVFFCHKHFKTLKYTAIKDIPRSTIQRREIASAVVDNDVERAFDSILEILCDRSKYI